MVSPSKSLFSLASAAVRFDRKQELATSIQQLGKAMRHFTGLLVLIILLCGLAGAGADTITQHLTFQAQNQSLWDASSNLAKSFDLTGSWSAYSFNEQARTRIDVLGTFSAGASGGVDAGRAGLIATAYANGGTVNVTYPMTLTLNYPDPSTLAPGQTFVLSSSWTPGTPTATPSLVTRSPDFGAKLNGVLEVPNVNLHLSARAFGVWLLNDDIFNFSLNFDGEIFDTKSLRNGTIDLFDGILSVAYKQPKLNLTGRMAGNDLYGYGLTQNADRSGTGFVSLSGNISNAIGYIVGMATIRRPIKFSDSINLNYSAHGLGFNLSGGYGILELIGAAGVGLEEEVRFRPAPMVTLWINDRDGLRTVTFPAGGSVQLTMPPAGSSLYIDPIVSLDNTFQNRVTAYASAGLHFYPFSIYGDLSLPGYSLPDLNYSVPRLTLFSGRAPLADLYNQTFKLGGFDDQFLPRMAITSPAPPPPTPLVANHDVYYAFISGGVNGPVYRVLAGYPNTPPGVLDNDTGPAYFEAVPHEWRPDPMDPDTYLIIDAAGRVDYSISKATVDAGGGQFVFPYQITDRNGNLATASLIISPLLP